MAGDAQDCLVLPGERRRLAILIDRGRADGHGLTAGNERIEPFEKVAPEGLRPLPGVAFEACGDFDRDNEPGRDIERGPGERAEAGGLAAVTGAVRGVEAFQPGEVSHARARPVEVVPA